MKIWLSYVIYPGTTAIYLDRALSRLAEVTTIGPRLLEYLMQNGQLYNIKLPLTNQDIDTDFTLNMAAIWSDIPQAERPDLYLWVESAGGHYPENLSAVTCTKACYLIDSHLNLENHLIWAQQFDHVFIAQLEYLPQFLEVNPNSHWLPLACDPAIHGRQPVAISHDISYVGSLALEPRRQELFERLKTEFLTQQERYFGADIGKVFSASKIIFNSSANNVLNMRFFEALCSGSLLLSDMTYASGQEILFREGTDYARYTDELLADTARFYLENDELRKMVAERGRHLVLNAHTYRHRCTDLLNVIQGYKQTTNSPQILRELSIKDIEEFGSAFSHRHSYFSTTSRSFVIPVLDYSPASEYSILTLLNDLEEIDGDVLVVFNSRQVAQELGTHPRITRSAIMQENVGVARAWNIGLNMATTQTVFFLNSDLHVTPAAIDQVDEYLQSLPNAACAGPQGSFNCFRLTSDFLYFDKGGTDIPVEVDSVSGFFFAIKKTVFDKHNLMFDMRYSPCYFEEWDIGLQIRRIGYKSYVVPSTSYDHEWGGSIHALSTIDCMGRSELRNDILKRNRILFISKWKKLIETEQRFDLLESGWRTYGPDYCRLQLKNGNIEEAIRAIDLLFSEYPHNPECIALHGIALHCKNKTDQSQECFALLADKHPKFHVNRFLASILCTESGT